MIFSPRSTRTAVKLLSLSFSILVAPSPVQEAGLSIQSRADHVESAPYDAPDLEDVHIMCEDSPLLRPLKEDCSRCMGELPYGETPGYFHQGDYPTGPEDYSLPDDGWECGSCKLFPHLSVPGKSDLSTWKDIKTALAQIIVRCAKKERDWDDVLTGGTAVIGQEKMIILDVRNLRIGIGNGNGTSGEDGGIAVAR